MSQARVVTYFACLLFTMLTLAPATRSHAESTYRATWDIRYRLPKDRIISRQDMKTHIQAHRNRVQALGIEAWNYISEGSPILTENMVRHVLSAHDQNKLTGFIYIDRSDRVDLPEFLSRFFGHSNSLDEVQRDLLIRGISRLNEMDRNSMRQAISDVLHQMPRHQHHSAIQQLMLIEHISDIVDRGLDPMARKEFGREMRLASQGIENTEIRELALFLENNYDRITQGLKFEDLKRQRVTLAEKKAAAKSLKTQKSEPKLCSKLFKGSFF